MIRSVLQVLAPDVPGVDTPGLTAGVVPVAMSADNLDDSALGTPAILNAGELRAYTETVDSRSPAGAAQTLDWGTRNTFALTLNGNITVTFSNVPGVTVSGRVNVYVVDTPGASVITWPAVDWGSSGAPGALAAGGNMMVTFVSILGGILGRWTD